MLELKIEATGVSEEEIIMAVEEALKQFKSGVNFAGDTREDETGSYNLEVSGYEEDYIECPHCGSTVYEINEKLPKFCPDCGAEIKSDDGE